LGEKATDVVKREEGRRRCLEGDGLSSHFTWENNRSFGGERAPDGKARNGGQSVTRGRESKEECGENGRNEASESQQVEATTK